MRILLVGLSELLPLAVTQVLNPENDYRAIVVDEVEPARKFLSQGNYPAENVFPLYELPECVENFFYDCVICVGNVGDKLTNEIKRCGVPKNKIIQLEIKSAENFLLDRALRYYQKNFSDFEMFATGASTVELGLLTKCFTKKLFNFGRANQDIYFCFQLAKKVISTGGGILNYALIGLQPYFLHFDESKSLNPIAYLTAYAIALKDLHNFWLPAEKYRSLFRQEYLDYKMSIDDIEIDEVSVLGDYSKQHMNLDSRIDARKRIDVWKNRNFPDTREENVKILDDYLTLCEENKIVPIIFLPPTTEGYKKYFSKQKLEEYHFVIRDALAKHKIAKFVDGWQLQGLSDADFMDVVHLNYNGAVKFSYALNDVIEKL